MYRRDLTVRKVFHLNLLSFKNYKYHGSNNEILKGILYILVSTKYILYISKSY